MEVDTNELLRRIGAVLRVISDKMDRLIEIAERVEGQVRLPSEEESKTFADVLMNDACIPSDAVADEPPKKWRILEPGEVVQEGDLMNSKLNPPSDPPNGGWLAATSFCFGKEASFYSHVYFARAVADEPAKEAEPAWEPKVGDWVLVRRPEDWKEWKNPLWPEELHIYNGKVFQVRGAFDTPVGHRVTLHGCEWFFHRDWLSPATTSQPLKIPPSLATVSGSGVRDSKPAEPQYRIPSLPDDAGKECEFSDDNENWHRRKLAYWIGTEYSFVWWSDSGDLYKYARIKKDA
jgi:hypothetical protein